MVIKHAEETNNCTAAWKSDVAELNVQPWRKQKELLKKQIESENHSVGPSTGNLNATDKKILEFRLEKCKDVLPVTEETILKFMEVYEVMVT
jgi:hypothetical protein